MKKGSNAPGFPRKPWTVVTYQVGGVRGLRTMYCAKNMLTGEQKQSRTRYVEALRDIPAGEQAESYSKYSEPWGV